MTKRTLRPWAIGIAAAYLIFASFLFAFRHPHMTDTERFLHTWDALLLRRVP